MKKIIFALIIALSGCADNQDIIKIIKAKEMVKSRLNYPDTADFHDLKTHVSGNVVSLTVTAKNAFGVPSTQTFNIVVD